MIENDLSSPRPNSSRPTATAWLRMDHALKLVLLLAMTSHLSGCSMFVMAGKLFFGDPKMTSSFKSATGTDLVSDRQRVLVVCSTPDSIKEEFPSLDFDLLDGVTRRLSLHNIDIVNPDDVATWLDDNGGSWDHPSDLAADFQTDFIIHIDLDRFTYKEENSPMLYRGRTSGVLRVYKVLEEDGMRIAREVYSPEYTSVYPEHNPISSSKFSAKVFRKRYLDRISDQIAQLFYDHRVSEQIH